MTDFEYRIIAASGYQNMWHDVKDGESNGIAGGRVEFRAKPSFEPGYFVDLSLVGEDRDRSTFADEPYQVRWMDEDPNWDLNPEDRSWKRVTVYDGDSREVHPDN